jgi:hypothetical protein
VGDSGSDSFLSSQSADPFTLCFPQPLCDLAEGVIHIAILGQAASVEPKKRQKGPRGGRWAPPYGQEVGPRACVVYEDLSVIQTQRNMSFTGLVWTHKRMYTQVPYVASSH